MSRMARHVLVHGAPGSGKGLISSLLQEQCGFRHVSVGQKLRQEVERKSPIGLSIAPILESGSLVPTETVLRVLLEDIKHAPHNQVILLDGFPRSQEQAELYMRWFGKPEMVLHLEAPGDVLKERLGFRASQAYRSDDTAECVEKRINLYSRTGLSVLNYFETRGCAVRTVSATGDAPAVLKHAQSEMHRVA